MEHSDRGYIWYDRADDAQGHSIPTFHVHDFCELYILLKGKKRYYTSDSIFDIGDGGALLISPGELHSFRTLTDEPQSRVLLYFTPSFLSRFADIIESEKIFGSFAVEKFSLSPEKLSRVLPITDAIGAGFQSASEFDRAFVQCKLFELLHVIFSGRRAEEVGARGDGNLLFDPRLKNIVYYIKDNYKKRLRLSDAAGHCHMNTNYFSGYFKKRVGINFSDYLNILRINEASRLLRSSELRVGEVAERCGFENISYFGYVFRKYCGCSPNELRRSSRSDH